MFPFDIWFKKKLIANSSKIKMEAYFNLILEELKYESSLSLKKLSMDENSISFKINYLGAGSSIFMALLSNGRFSICRTNEEIEILYNYKIGGRFIQMSILWIIISIVAFSVSELNRYELIFSLIKIYLVGFIILWLVTLATQKMFFGRIIKKLIIESKK